MEETYKVQSSAPNLGPKGFGDPEDRSLRRVEVDVKIAQKVRDKSRQVKCVPEVEEFNNCVSDHSLLFFAICRKQNDVVRQCMTKWFHDKDLWNECTEEYLNERSEYRRTGIPTHKYQRTKH